MTLLHALFSFHSVFRVDYYVLQCAYFPLHSNASKSNLQNEMNLDTSFPFAVVCIILLTNREAGCTANECILKIYLQLKDFQLAESEERIYFVVTEKLAVIGLIMQKNSIKIVCEL